MTRFAEVFGSESKCFRSSLLRPGLLATAGPLSVQGFQPMCYGRICSSTGLKVCTETKRNLRCVCLFPRDCPLRSSFLIVPFNQVVVAQGEGKVTLDCPTEGGESTCPLSRTHWFVDVYPSFFHLRIVVATFPSTNSVTFFLVSPKGIISGVPNYEGSLSCPPAFHMCEGSFASATISSLSPSSLPSTLDRRMVTLSGKNFPSTLDPSSGQPLHLDSFTLYFAFEEIGTLVRISSTEAVFALKGGVDLPENGSTPVRARAFGRLTSTKVERPDRSDHLFVSTTFAVVK